VSALFDVALWASETINQEITKPLLGAFEIMCRIHRPQNIVTVDLPVECRHKTRETLFSDERKNPVFIHEYLGSSLTPTS
jgi:hypothetical protein